MSAFFSQFHSAVLNPHLPMQGEVGFLLTIIISPRHLAHSMDKRTRANGNGDMGVQDD
jgi:hypothetical protein